VHSVAHAARCAAASDLAAILCRCRHETAAEGQPGGSCGTGSDGAQGPSRAAGRMQPYLAMMLDRGPAATDAPTQSRAPQLTLLQAAQRRLAFALGMRSGLPGEVTDMDVVAAVCAHVTGLRWSRHELDKPLAKYVEFNNIKLLEAGLRAGRDPNDPKEFTCPISYMENCAPLFIAAWCGSTPATVELLLKSGADTGWVDRCGNTALYQAVESRHTELVLLLGAQPGAALDARGSSGAYSMTPLCVAAKHGDKQTVRALLQLGADASLFSQASIAFTAPAHERYKTALAFAKAAGKHEVAEILRDPPELLPSGLLVYARRRGLADAAIPTGTRLRVEAHGEGTYTRFKRKIFGANTHFVRFDAAEGTIAAEQPVQLKGLGPAAWSVLPQLTVELEIVEETGATSVLGGVSLGWTVEQLGRAIGEQRGVAPALLRLIVGEQALDGKEALLLPACGIGSQPPGVTRVHVVEQTDQQAATGGAVEEGQPPARDGDSLHQARAAPVPRGGQARRATAPGATACCYCLST
jgi:hypothetical protein